MLWENPNEVFGQRYMLIWYGVYRLINNNTCLFLLFYMLGKQQCKKNKRRERQIPSHYVQKILDNCKC